MKKNVIISLADANYFELLNDLIDSIKRFKENDNSAICILDAGLTKEQKEILSLKVDEIKSAEWDIEVPDFKVKGKEWLKSQVSRAFLPKYFPNYKKYLCIFMCCSCSCIHINPMRKKKKKKLKKLNVEFDKVYIKKYPVYP